MKYILFDIETDAINASRIHVLSYITEAYHTPTSITSYEEMRDLFENNKDRVLIGHAIILFDIPILERILNISIENERIDTLALSWYLYSWQNFHSLEAYADSFVQEKIQIDDWENLDIQEYIKRCERDIEINLNVFQKQFKYLSNIYNNDVTKILKYLSFKFKCLKENAKNKIKLDTFKARKLFEDLTYEYEMKILALQEVMPRQVLKERPKLYLKKDGTLSKKGEEWINLVLSLIPDQKNPISVEKLYNKGNPKSTQQLKEWLFSLGWKPKTFKVSTSTGEKVPQISQDKGVLCPSVKHLIENVKEVEELEGLTRVKHRLDVTKAFLTTEENGYVVSRAHGFTNTLRLTHSSPLVNLPKPSMYLGKEIRELLTCEDNEILCGIDIKALEASTADHYMYVFDPEYVKKRREPGFDPHLYLGVLAGLITEEESVLYKETDAKLENGEEVSEDILKVYKEIGNKRFLSKSTNFSAIYGAGAAKIAEVSGRSINEARKLFDIFWKLNHSIKKVSDSVTVRDVFGSSWLYNPVSRLWLYVKAKKDIFSTLNQSTGVYVFDLFMMLLMKKVNGTGKLIFQYHDEMIIRLIDSEVNKVFIKEQANGAVKELNNLLKLNVEIKISLKFGKNYAEIH
jgi:hypothetical protein